MLLQEKSNISVSTLTLTNAKSERGKKGLLRNHYTALFIFHNKFVQYWFLSDGFQNSNSAVCVCLRT